MPAPLPKPASPPTKSADPTVKSVNPPTPTSSAPAPATLPKPTIQSISTPPVSPAKPAAAQKAPTPSIPVAPQASQPPAPKVAAPQASTPAPTSSVPTTSAQPAAQVKPVTVPTMPSKPAPVAPTAPMSAPASTTTNTVPSSTPAAPKQSLPAQPAAPVQPQAAVRAGATPVPVAPTIPGAPQSPIPQQPVRIQTPPKTLTALSSMASNKLPADGAAPTTPQSAPAPTKSAPTMTATPQAPQKPGDPQFVQPKKSWMSFLPYIGGGILLLFILGFVAFKFLGLGGTTTTSVQSTSNGKSSSQTATGGTNGSTTAAGPKVTLEYWGLWEPTETMATVIKDYESKNPNVTIKYSKQSHQDYRVRLQNALNSDNGPDLFRYHASWVPMLRQQLSALPVSVMSPNEYQTTFYPAAVSQLQSNGQIVGIPLMYDGLVLFYNKDLFDTAVVEPPKTWSDLRTVASQLKLESGNTLTRGGIAMGNATNVEHFSDILALLILQNGGDLSKPSSKEVHDALLFYTNFVKTDEVWSDTLPSSTIAFARGEVAMMFAPSWRAHEIKAMNPELKFATAPVPQLSDKRISWATYWAEGVNAKTTKKDEAWKFLKYLSSKEIQQKLFTDQAKTRAFGELYSRKDLANDLASDPVASAIMQDAPYAQGWQMSSYTHDDGANDQIIKYYEDAVTALNQGKSIEEVQATLTQGVSQVLRQYGIASATTTP